jgi:hypothetical protein
MEHAVPFRSLDLAVLKLQWLNTGLTRVKLPELQLLEVTLPDQPSRSHTPDPKHQDPEVKRHGIQSIIRTR